ncbi:hypothetical protein Dsin_009114 [Dipteronia sinensis]|uniref:AT3G52170-like helix-turn-helix domain-containing protein n=1 Tax=Dipteronia sinensis TaxID=43782 RepID=A0AAE0AR75_9ROSI|nr:hypothetical protein Dsin_009114 [Dipteronia sinensis]
MHTLKGGWAVQTFALAKNNESEGRKSRIRRSKEERKAMVESFIKKYQSSNNGNFPSLNLTHKEVGGSFYTVREIVREVIQENRVLGPAKFSPEELNYLQDEQGPLGSIAIEPSTPLYITSNESHFVPNHHQATSEESVSISDGLCSENEIQRFENVQIIKGCQYQVDVRIEESDKQKSEDLKTSDQLEAEKNSAACTAIVIPIAEDIVVETFPLTPVPDIVDGLDTSSVVRNLNETFEENETEKVKLEQGNGSAPLGQITSSANSNLVIERKAEILTTVVFDKNSDLVDEKVAKNFADPQLKSSYDFTTEGSTLSDTRIDTDVDGLDTSSVVRNLNETFEENVTERVKLEQGNDSALIGEINSSANSNLVIEKKREILTAVVFDKNSDLVDEEAEENFADPQLKSSNNFTTEGGTVSDTHVDTDVEIEVLHNNVLIPEIYEQSQRVDGSKAINAPNGKSPNGNYASREQVRTPETIVFENEANVQGEVNSHKGSNPTLDRINLASWEGASRKSAETKTNPILVVFKSFVTAVIKFWSE